MRGSDPSVRLAGECMIGAIQHTLGDQISARLHLEQVLTHYAASNHAGKAIRLQDFFRFGIEVQISARVFLARVLWLQGFSDQALRAAETSLGEATGHDYSVCYALAFAACPDRALGREPCRRSALCRDATRSFEKARLSSLGRVGF